MEIYGYARVSSKDQNIKRQIDAFHQAGIEDKYILVDKKTGKDFDRKYYNLLVGTENTAPLLRSGDCLVILDLDRLGRNYKEIHKQWRVITEELGADIKVLSMPLLDTCAITDTLDKKFIRDLVFQILSYVAEKERDNIKKRQKEGIESAKEAGKKFGRPQIKYPDKWEDVYEKWSCGSMSTKEAFKVTGLAKATFYRIVKRWEEENKIARYKGIKEL